MNHAAQRARAGFSLMEVNIALLVVGIGLVSLLGLFPVGLRESALATSDTVQATVAEHVLSQIRANAMLLTNWSDATGPAATAWTVANLGKGILVDGQPLTPDNEGKAECQADKYLGVERNTVRCRLQLGDVPDYDQVVKFAALQVSDRSVGTMDREPVYYTEFVFMGM